MRIKPKTNIASLEISHMTNCNLEAYMLLITLCFFTDRTYSGLQWWAPLGLSGCEFDYKSWSDTRGGRVSSCCLCQLYLRQKTIWCQVFKKLEDIPAVTHLAGNLSCGESRRFGTIMSCPVAALRFRSGKSRQCDAEPDLQLNCYSLW